MGAAIAGWGLGHPSRPQHQRQAAHQHVPARHNQGIAVLCGEAAEHRTHRHGRRRPQHPELSVAPGLEITDPGTLQPPMAQQVGGQPQAENAQHTEQQANPTHRVDGLTKKGTGQQGH